MSTLAEIEAAAEQLSPKELQQLVQRLTQCLERTPMERPKKRTAGLHPGAMEMAPDFHDPLPDEFWLGKDT